MPIWSGNQVRTTVWIYSYPHAFVEWWVGVGSMILVHAICSIPWRRTPQCRSLTAVLIFSDLKIVHHHAWGICWSHVACFTYDALLEDVILEDVVFRLGLVEVRELCWIVFGAIVRRTLDFVKTRSARACLWALQCFEWQLFVWPYLRVCRRTEG